MERHESLRTHFGEVDGEPVQIVEEALRMEVPLEDLSGLDQEKRHKKTREAMKRAGEEPFDLARGPLLRMKLLKLGEGD